MTAQLSVERPDLNNLSNAAELIARWIGHLLDSRLAWLEANPADRPEDEHAWIAGTNDEMDAALRHRLAGPEGSIWTRLVDLFQLSAAEADLLAVAVAVAVEPALGPLVAKAQGASTRFTPSEPLIKRLFGHPPEPIWKPISPLAMWGLVSSVKYAPGEPLGFEADPRLIDWLFGTLTLDAQLVLGVDTAEFGPVPSEWPVDATANRLDAALVAGVNTRLLVEARKGTGRRTFAAAVAQALGREAVVVNPTPLAPDDWAEHFMRVQRFALFADFAVIWKEGAPAWPDKIPLAPLQFICVSEGQNPPPCDRATDLIVVLRETSVATKAAIWRAMAPKLAEQAEQLAATPGLTLSDLVEAGRVMPTSYTEASAHLRALARVRMSGAGRVVDPRFDWDDFVAKPDLLVQLQRIVFEARTRPALMENPETARLFGGNMGLSVLFSGPPGVGKSMAAQVIAKDLGINLLVIDLGATTSKWVGETAKNLTAAFSQARIAGAALIFEEADAFFAKRTDVKDANDRHANADTNHLLQLLEAHDGLVILSTNRRANIDPAFIRRLRHVVEFPKPGPAERRLLWGRLLSGLAIDPAPLAAELDQLAENLDLSPAQIKGAALSACYTARASGRTVTAADLEQGAASELTKEGRSMLNPAASGNRRNGHRKRSLNHA